MNPLRDEGQKEAATMLSLHLTLMRTPRSTLSALMGNPSQRFKTEMTELVVKQFYILIGS